MQFDYMIWDPATVSCRSYRATDNILAQFWEYYQAIHSLLQLDWKLIHGLLTQPVGALVFILSYIELLPRNEYNMEETLIFSVSLLIQQYFL